jgi:hypothetical protein
MMFVTFSPAQAGITEVREGDANPMVSVFKSTAYGGLAGWLLGAAIELISEDIHSDSARWGFIGGTMFGFGYGVYHIMHRPEPVALLDLEDGHWAVAVPTVELAVVRPDSGTPLAPFARDESVRELRVPLVGFAF